MEFSTDEIDFAEKDPTGRYIRYDEILGTGASKIVYKAFDQVEGIEVAWNQIDMSHSDAQQMEQLHSEVKILRSLNHSNIMKFHHSWIDEKTKTLNMITELLTSGSLKQYRAKHKKVDIKAVKNWARQILRALDHLHNHNPQIIHRDLKCDNLFVNGYNGKVKIGDLGFATDLQQHTENCFIGTPQFMAPELYDEDYDELVDVYSFGMCILELVTGEYPYAECKNVPQIYKKVITGVKPASLAKVVDPRVKQFIDKCLVPASMRPSAAQLLNDPFLSSETATTGPLNDITCTSTNNVTCSTSSGATSHHSSHELETFKENTRFWLKGQQADDHMVSLTIRKITNLAPCREHTDIIEFMFYLDSDTTQSIATEMADQLDLATEEICTVVELLEGALRKIVPAWKPCYGIKQSNYSDKCYSITSVEDKYDNRDDDSVEEKPEVVSWYRQCFTDLLKEAASVNAAKETCHVK